MDYEAVYLPKNHFIKEESMATEDYLALFYPFDKLDVVKRGVESSWNVSGDNMMIALTMTFMDEPMAKNMSFQREYAEPYDWVAQQFKDWAFTLTTCLLYTSIPCVNIRIQCLHHEGVEEAPKRSHSCLLYTSCRSRNRRLPEHFYSLRFWGLWAGYSW